MTTDEHPTPPPPPVDYLGEEILDLTLGYGEPNLPAPDWGPDAWSLWCTRCNHHWYDTPWTSCPRCANEYHNQPLEVTVTDQDDDETDTALRDMLVNWDEFWAHDHAEADWLAEPIIAAKRSTAMFAPGGTGKSLLALYIAACLATGRRLFGHDSAPIDVLYLDYEMTADDLSERLQSMGFGDDVDMTRLHYALLPSLPGLDEPEGGKAVVRLAELCNAELVVIDTFGRAVHGDENDADTVRSWYRWTGIHLKHAGRAFMRVDHAGKDVTKGQRGTSAKNDDVDVVWQMVAKDGGAFTLTAKKRRMGWVPMSVDLVMHDDDTLRFELAAGATVPAGTAEMMKLLDDLGVDVDLSASKAARMVRDAGHSGRNEVIRAAQKRRRQELRRVDFVPPEPVDNPAFTSAQSRPNQSGRGRAETAQNEIGRGAGRGGARYAKDQVDALGAVRGAVGRGSAANVGRGAPPLRGRAAHTPEFDTPQTTDPDAPNYVPPLF